MPAKAPGGRTRNLFGLKAQVVIQAMFFIFLVLNYWWVSNLGLNYWIVILLKT